MDQEGCANEKGCFMDSGKDLAFFLQGVSNQPESLNLLFRHASPMYAPMEVKIVNEDILEDAWIDLGGGLIQILCNSRDKCKKDSRHFVRESFWQEVCENGRYLNLWAL
jgi:hypothetical protein